MSKAVAVNPVDVYLPCHKWRKTFQVLFNYILISDSSLTLWLHCTHFFTLNDWLGWVWFGVITVSNANDFLQIYEVWCEWFLWKAYLKKYILLKAKLDGATLIRAADHNLCFGYFALTPELVPFKLNCKRAYGVRDIWLEC